MSQSRWREFPTVFLVCCERSGSSQVMQLLRLFRGVEVFPELFHPRGPDSGVSSLALAAGLPAKVGRAPDLGRWVRADPLRALDVLAASAPPSTLAFATKLFPTFLEHEFLDRCLMAAPNAHFVTLTRSPIDTFISLTKAKSMGEWAHVDTTNLRPSLQVDEFVAWHRRISDWYRQVEGLLARHGRQDLRLVYEADVNVDEPRTLGRLREILATVGVMTEVDSADGLPAGAVPHRPWWSAAWYRLRGRRLALRQSGQRGYVRQERSRQRETRVNNWDAFVAGLSREHDLRMLDHYV